MIFPPPPIGWVGSESDTNHEQSINALHQLYHALWREIHCKEHPDEQWFSSLLSRVPNSECGCFAWLLDYVKLNPPRYNDWFRWSWEMHNAVNLKLNKPEQAFEDVKAHWLGQMSSTTELQNACRRTA